MVEDLRSSIFIDEFDCLLISIVRLLPTKRVDTLVKDVLFQVFEGRSLFRIVFQTRLNRPLKQCPVLPVKVNFSAVVKVSFFIIACEQLGSC